MRTMYDATVGNAAVLVAKNPEMVAIYLTGGPSIAWTSKQVQLFKPTVKFVRIDQAGNGAPKYVAHVMDVEPGAYRPGDVPGWTSKCTAPRPTVYCDRADLPAVMAVWKGAIWLAAPGLSASECAAEVAANKQIVAIQNVFAGSFDSSLVFDPTWPEKATPPPPPPPPPPPAKQFEVQIERYQPGFGWVLEQTFTTKPGTKFRARVSDGTWSPWQEFNV